MQYLILFKEGSQTFDEVANIFKKVNLMIDNSNSSYRKNYEKLI